MRIAAYCLILSTVLLSTAAGQESARPTEGAREAVADAAIVRESESSARRVYNIRVTEYRLRTAPAEELTADQIIQELVGGRANELVSSIHSVRVAALEGQESVVQFGQMTAVTTGVSNAPGRQRVRTMQDRPTGTLLKATVRLVDNQKLLEIQYESSRFPDGDATAAATSDHGHEPASNATETAAAGQPDWEVSSPDMLTARVQTAIPVELGRPRLLAGSSGNVLSYLVLQGDEAQ